MKKLVLEILAGLGTSSDEIASCLYRQGIRGERNSYTRCPLAKYLSRVTEAEIVVSEWVIFANGNGFSWNLCPHEIPHVVKEFLRRLDQTDELDFLLSKEG